MLSPTSSVNIEQGIGRREMAIEVRTADFAERNFIRGWFWFHLVCVLALAFQTSTPATVLGRYSVKAAVILAAFVVTLPLPWFGASWFARYQIRFRTLPGWTHRAIFGGCAGLLFLAWAFHIGPTRSYAIVRLYFTSIIIATATISLRQLTLPRWLARLPSLIGIATLTLLFLLSSIYPGLKWTDEGYVASAGWGYATTGEPVVLIHYPLITETFSVMFRLLGVWFEAFGVSLTSARVFTLILTTLALVITLRPLQTVYGKPAAWGSIVLGAFSFASINYLYSDAEIPLFMAAAFALYVTAQRSNRPWLHFFVGLAVSLSVDGHPVAYRFGLMFAAAYAVEWFLVLRRHRRWVIDKRFLYLALGGLVGLGAYVAFYSVTTSRFDEFSSNSPFFVHSLSETLRIVRDQLDNVLQDAPLLFGFVLAGAVAAVKRNQPLDRLLFLSIFGSAFVLAALYERNRQYYLVHSIIPMVWLAAGGLAMLGNRLRIDKKSQMIGGVVFLIAVASVGMMYDKVAYREAQSYRPALRVAREIRELVPQDQVFVGVDPFFFEMSDYSGFMDVTVAYMWAKKQPEPITELEAWSELAPDAVAVVHDYPLPQHVETLVAYINTQTDMQRVQCWQVGRLGQIDLYLRNAELGVAVPSDCRRLD